MPSIGSESDTGDVWSRCTGERFVTSRSAFRSLCLESHLAVGSGIRASGVFGKVPVIVWLVDDAQVWSSRLYFACGRLLLSPQRLAASV
jgi:hypothetical protein